MRPVAFCFAVLSLSWSLPAFAQTAFAQPVPIDSIQADLRVAVCRNDWPQAIDLINQLIGNEEISPVDRERLVGQRAQLQEWRSTGARFANLPNCTAPVAAASVATFSTRVVPSPAPTVAPLVALSPVIALDVSSGSGSQFGRVSRGQQVYSFNARAGDRVAVDINVTRVMPGAPFNDDDSQLFLFDSAGQLIAENDDDRDSFQSRIRNFTIPYDGTFFVVVTTFNNDPILNSNRIVTNWEGDGSSNIEYRLTVTNMTLESQQ